MGDLRTGVHRWVRHGGEQYWKAVERVVQAFGPDAGPLVYRPRSNHWCGITNRRGELVGEVWMHGATVKSRVLEAPVPLAEFWAGDHD